MHCYVVLTRSSTICADCLYCYAATATIIRETLSAFNTADCKLLQLCLFVHCIF